MPNGRANHSVTCTHLRIPQRCVIPSTDQQQLWVELHDQWYDDMVKCEQIGTVTHAHFVQWDVQGVVWIIGCLIT